jgi:hypothetical protein
MRSWDEEENRCRRFTAKALKMIAVALLKVCFRSLDQARQQGGNMQNFSNSSKLHC